MTIAREKRKNPANRDVIKLHDKLERNTRGLAKVISALDSRGVQFEDLDAIELMDTAAAEILRERHELRQQFNAALMKLAAAAAVAVVLIGCNGAAKHAQQQFTPAAPAIVRHPDPANPVELQPGDYVVPIGCVKVVVSKPCLQRGERLICPEVRLSSKCVANPDNPNETFPAVPDDPKGGL